VACHKDIKELNKKTLTLAALCLLFALCGYKDLFGNLKQYIGSIALNLIFKIISMDLLQRSVGDKLECLLCPHYCKIAEGKTGICGVRKNTGKTIELITYGVISGYSPDPIEKKPLYHFFPGKKILSVGSYGCNMRCDFCQNYNISQAVPRSLNQNMSPEDLVNSALEATNNIGLAFTYNEPVIWFEFMRDSAILAKKTGLHTAMVSNGYVNSQPLNELTNFIDAFNIDLKAFNNYFYTKLTGSDLEPVKQALKQISRSGKHLEITTLVIPGMNDTAKEMSNQAEWIAGELGRDVPLHLSRYYPMYKRDDPATSEETLLSLYETASEKLDNVYLGNTHSDRGQDTKCLRCEAVVTKRHGYSTRVMNLDKEGRCMVCGTMIYRYYSTSSSKEH
jgi:pyruvate formate lyase activating enzyme